MKVVVNECIGSFSLSYDAFMHLITLGSKHASGISNSERRHGLRFGCYLYDIPREDPLLVRTVLELGKKANGKGAELGIVEIPDDVQWWRVIDTDDYPGFEYVMTDKGDFGQVAK